MSRRLRYPCRRSQTRSQSAWSMQHDSFKCTAYKVATRHVLAFFDTLNERLAVSGSAWSHKGATVTEGYAAYKVMCKTIPPNFSVKALSLVTPSHITHHIKETQRGGFVFSHLDHNNGAAVGVKQGRHAGQQLVPEAIHMR